MGYLQKRKTERKRMKKLTLNDFFDILSKNDNVFIFEEQYTVYDPQYIFLKRKIKKLEEHGKEILPDNIQGEIRDFQSLNFKYGFFSSSNKDKRKKSYDKLTLKEHKAISLTSIMKQIIDVNFNNEDKEKKSKLYSFLRVSNLKKEYSLISLRKTFKEIKKEIENFLSPCDKVLWKHSFPLENSLLNCCNEILNNITAINRTSHLSLSTIKIKIERESYDSEYLQRHANICCRGETKLVNHLHDKVAEVWSDAIASLLKNINKIEDIKEDNKIEEDKTEERKEGEERKKNTNEVADTSDNPSNESELHGGDSNSGEVDSVAETAAQEDRNNNNSNTDNNNNNGNDSNNDNSDNNNVVSLAELDKIEEIEEIEEEDKLINNSRTCFGGNHLSETKFKISPKAKRKAEKAKKLLTQLLDITIGLEKPSKKVDGTRLITELVSKRCKLSRIYQKRRSNNEKYIVAIDVSGSCSSHCTELFNAVRMIQQEADNLLLVLHSNGFLVSVYYNRNKEEASFGKLNFGDDGYRRQNQKNWDELLSFANSSLKTVLFFGDGDADWMIGEVAKKCKDTYMFHNFGASLNAPYKGTKKCSAYDAKHHYDALKGLIIGVNSDSLEKSLKIAIDIKKGRL
jgi:hypothetical protein